MIIIGHHPLYHFIISLLFNHFKMTAVLSSPKKSPEIDKKEIVSLFLKKKVLVSPEIVAKIKVLSDNQISLLFDKLKKRKDDGLLILNSETLNFFLKNSSAEEFNFAELERSKAHLEKGRNSQVYAKFLELLGSVQEEVFSVNEIFPSIYLSGISFIKHCFDSSSLSPLSNPSSPAAPSKTKIVYSFDEKPDKASLNDFVSIFKNRLEVIGQILQQRQELKKTLSINKILAKKQKEEIAAIGLVYDISQTKNGHYFITLEDTTGRLKILVSKNNSQLIEKVKDVVLDEVIGLVGTKTNNFVFANEIFWPDFPLKEYPSIEEEEYAVFTADLHVGSNLFLAPQFNKFLKWLRGEIGSDEQKQIAQKIKYLFVVGDAVDGVGIYPGQEDELTIKDINKQYQKFGQFLAQVPPQIDLIVCPGNHDASRLSEPQPPLSNFYQDLIEQEAGRKIIFVSNPSLVNIGSSEKSAGLDVLLYHGSSFDYYNSTVDSIRERGGHDNLGVVMSFLLKRRHLAPSHTSTLYIHSKTHDPLVIKQVPHLFVTGHWHKSVVGNYRGVKLVSCSCWQPKTDYQEKLGHTPEPGRVPILNLKTGKMKIIKFD